MDAGCFHKELGLLLTGVFQLYAITGTKLDAGLELRRSPLDGGDRSSLLLDAEMVPAT